MVMTSATAAEVGSAQGTDRTGLGDVWHVGVGGEAAGGREVLLQVSSLEEEAVTCACACGHVADSLCVHVR